MFINFRTIECFNGWCKIYASFYHSWLHHHHTHVWKAQSINEFKMAINEKNTWKYKSFRYFLLLFVTRESKKDRHMTTTSVKTTRLRSSHNYFSFIYWVIPSSFFCLDQCVILSCLCRNRMLRESSMKRIKTELSETITQKP